ncbi:FAD-binding oxidoreductase [Janibacter hoylei]|uniref:FAD-binding oxidoreductase n=1 Tax=Janibacter hoylei TaxID=364298 RepID=UPI0021A379AA|nr:FAD-binding oxidoreductase [Janibacter hoylei]MCT2294516.1 FAD-binding oxidoreductase [Janibacter hoylei]
MEDAVTEKEAAALVRRVQLVAPGHDFTAHRAPDPADLGLVAPRIVPPRALAAICSDDPSDRAGHAHGKAFRDVVRNLRGDLTHVPDWVARPHTEADVIALLDWCAESRVAVVPYGGGSSVVGGVENRTDGPSVTVDLGRLDRVAEVDRTSRAARIQGGVYGPHLENQLRLHGLTLRHFPQSFQFSTLGGWLATRAGGHFASLYTHIDDLTESLRVVTPAGITESRRLPGSGAGPSHDRLFLGSEGSLGIITEAWMRLQERPAHQLTASIEFDTFAEAVDATRAVAQSGLYPTNCRLLDPAEALVNADVATGGGILVLAFESADHPVTAWMDRALELVADHGGRVRERKDRASAPGETADGAGAADSWRSSFLRMPYQRDALAQRSMVVETFETACTWDRFETFHAAVTSAAQEAVDEVCGSGIVTCRFTHVYPDGPAPYYGIYAPGRWDGLLAQWDQIKAAVSEAIIAGGGTITHHHAIGRDHAPWYARQRGDLFGRTLQGAKSVVDPAGIMNPGVLGLG